MVFEPNEKVKSKMLKDGNVLKYMYGVAGAGKGLIAGGAMLVFVGLLLMVMLLQTFEMPQALVAGGALAGPGVLLLILGVFLQKRRMDNWIKAYVKHTGLSEEDILKAAEEFKQPGTVLLSFEKGKDANSLKKMGFITKNYLKLPGVIPSMARLDDVVACFFTKKFLCKDGGYDKAFIAYSKDEKMAYMNTGVSEKDGVEMAEAIAKRNPEIIKYHHFTYQDKEYDAVRNMDEVIRLHSQVTGSKS